MVGVKITLKVEKCIAFPTTDHDADELKKCEGGFFSVDMKRVRNVGFHKYAMKMLHIMHDMVDEPLGFEPWRRLLTIKAGYFTTIGKVSVNGTTSVAVEAESLAFGNMDDARFKEVWNGIHQAFVDKYGKSLTEQQLTEWSCM